MTVYLDLLFLDNFCADAALLYCSVKTVKGDVRILRIALTALCGALLGVGYAVFRLYYSLSAPVDYLIKFSVAFVLPLFAVRCKRKRTYLLCSLAFSGYLFAFAGLLTALFSSPLPGLHQDTLAYTVYGIPSGVLVALCVVFAVLAVKVVSRLTRCGKVRTFTYSCKLVLGGVSVRTHGFLDTGNRLCDARGKPVAVAERSLAVRLFRERLFSGKTPSEKIAVQTCNGISLMTAFKIDEIEIYSSDGANILKDVTVAVSSQPLAGEYEILLPPAFIENGDG